MLERRTDWLKRAQFDEVRGQITERLPHLRNRMAVDEFDQVVRAITLVRLKCEVNRMAARLPEVLASETVIS
jgi:sensor histidine kinase regulating citrate/malate metabolism